MSGCLLSIPYSVVFVLLGSAASSLAEAEAGGGGKRRPLEGERIEAEDMLWATSMV